METMKSGVDHGIESDEISRQFVVVDVQIEWQELREAPCSQEGDGFPQH